MTYQHVDLKVCEGCGALWLRNASLANSSATPAGVYCRHCASRLSEFPQPSGLRQPYKPRIRNRSGAQSLHSGAPSMRPHRMGGFPNLAVAGGAR